MAFGLKVTVNTDKLDSYRDALWGKLEAVVEKSSRNVERKAKEIIIAKDIIDTGATLNSTLSRRSQGGNLLREIGPTTEYAPLLEYGSQGRRARPYMTPAGESERGPFEKAVMQILRDI